jgi:UDP-N-acetylglucosamine 2-epimerase (non-hydrolysing)
MNVGLSIGTRPEAIKLMPVLRALQRVGIDARVFVTGQHDQVLEPILSELNILPTERLHVMEADQSLGDLSARLLRGVQDILRRHRPDVVLVQGDTTSAAMSALAGFYEHIPVGHVEAGLRTESRRNPFPEEMNRRLVGCLADIHFAPTPMARQNLLREGVPAAAVHMVGNTVVDALFYARDELVPALPPDPELEALAERGCAVVLVTAHRRESFGADLAAICRGVGKLAAEHPDRLAVFFPVHLNPNVQSMVRPLLSSVSNVRLTPPLSYLRFLRLMLRAKLIITDSGGVQEEAATLGIPVLVTRRTCERLEAVEAGVSQVVGPHADGIVEAAERLLGDAAAYRGRAVPTGVFGDGRAAERIVTILREYHP